MFSALRVPQRPKGAESSWISAPLQGWDPPAQDLLLLPVLTCRGVPSHKGQLVPKGGGFAALPSSCTPELGRSAGTRSWGCAGDEQGHAGGPRGLTQSTMRILLSFPFCCSCLAAMATELKKQNPLKRGSQSCLTLRGPPRAPSLLATCSPACGLTLPSPPDMDTDRSRGAQSGTISVSEPSSCFLGLPKCQPKALHLGRALTWQWKDPRDVRAAAPQRSHSGDKTKEVVRSAARGVSPHLHTPAGWSYRRGTGRDRARSRAGLGAGQQDPTAPPLPQARGCWPAWGPSP